MATRPTAPRAWRAPARSSPADPPGEAVPEGSAPSTRATTRSGESCPRARGSAAPRGSRRPARAPCRKSGSFPADRARPRDASDRSTCRLAEARFAAGSPGLRRDRLRSSPPMVSTFGARISFGLGDESLLASDGAEVIGLSVVLGMRRCTSGVDFHAADGIDGGLCHWEIRQWYSPRDDSRTPARGHDDRLCGATVTATSCSRGEPGTAAARLLLVARTGR